MRHYNKLVRDKIPEKIRAHGDTPVIQYIDNPRDFKWRLLMKLFEEVGEYSHVAAQGRESDSDKALEELTDIAEVVISLAAQYNCSPERFEALRAAKADKNGGFTQGVILVEA